MWTERRGGTARRRRRRRRDESRWRVKATCSATWWPHPSPSHRHKRYQPQSPKRRAPMPADHALDHPIPVTIKSLPRHPSFLPSFLPSTIYYRPVRDLYSPTTCSTPFSFIYLPLEILLSSSYIHILYPIEIPTFKQNFFHSK